jgi:hypothetical protein
MEQVKGGGVGIGFADELKLRMSAEEVSEPLTS